MIKELINKTNRTIKEDQELRRLLTKEVYNSNNDYIIDAYFKGYDKFIIELDKLNNKHLRLLDMKEIKFLNIANKINKYDLEHLFLIA